MNWLRNTEFTRIQQRNHKDCSIASLAMALGCSYEEAGTSMPLTAQETVGFLAKQRLIPMHLITREAAEKVCGAYGSQLLTADEVKKACARRPGILTVQGGRELHAVYWTGYEVIDPAPGREEPRKWEDYEVLEAISIF